MSSRAIARNAMLFGIAGVLLATPGLANDAAHVVADKFAQEERKAEDAKKREAEIKADEERKAAAARRAEELLRADKARQQAKVKAGETARARERQSDEADMLARARREADEMKAAEEARILAEQAAAMERARVELERSQAAEQGRAKADAAARRTAEQDRLRLEELARGAAEQDKKRSDAETQEPTRSSAESERLARQRMEETRRLAEKLRRVREIRDARLAAQARRAESGSRPQHDDRPTATVNAPTAEVPPPQATARDTGSGGPAPVAATQPSPPVGPTVDMPAAPTRQDAPPALIAAAQLRDTRVAVLLVLAPGTYGIRRNGPKVADPVLCTLEGCYVSAGADAPAIFMPGRKALNFGNTWGARAGACRQRLGCVFRNVELSEIPGYLQPVDLHILKHDRRRGQVITTDSACQAEMGRVFCARGIYTDDYSMWIMPEHLAATAGGEALQRAVAEGLNGPRSAGLAPVR